MKLTKIGVDYVTINEDFLKNEDSSKYQKIHIINLEFSSPTKEKVEAVLNLFNKTNRYVISNNIRFYNDILKYTTKKYYVMNNVGNTLITFLRKNNKVLLNVSNLSAVEINMIMQKSIMEDVLRNIEVIMLKRKIYNVIDDILENWNGNVIIQD